MQVTLASHRSPDATSTDVAALHADTCDLGHPGSPSATVAILREQPDAVDCLVLVTRPSRWRSQASSA